MATVIVVGPMDTGLARVWVGYQMPITSGLPAGSAATPCWKPAAWTLGPASIIASAAAADSRFDLLIVMEGQPVVDREAIVGTTLPQAMHLATKRQPASPSNAAWR